MNRTRLSLLVILLAGCSTHPVTDFCDLVQPGKLGRTTVQQPYGGVGIPQGPIIPVATVPGGGVAPVPGVGVIPGPLPLPGNQPPGPQLQPPTPGDIPLPPPPPPAKF